MSLTRETARELQRPLPSSAVRFRADGEPDAKGRVRCLVYIDARMAAFRLTDAAPGWEEQYEALPAGSGSGVSLRCLLTVEGTTRIGYGNGNDVKAAESDALKRAAVKFGVGASLYGLPTLYASEGGYWVKRNGKIGGLTATGVKELRAAYTKWITHKEWERFGPLVDWAESLEEHPDATEQHETPTAEPVGFGKAPATATPTAADGRLEGLEEALT